jgi:hypothetical protein
MDKHRVLARVEGHIADLELVLGWLVGFEPTVVEPGEGLDHPGVSSCAQGAGLRLGNVRDSSLRPPSREGLSRSLRSVYM